MATVNANTNPTPQDTAINCKPPSSIPIEGNLVSMTGNHMVMTSVEGIRHPLSLAKNVKVTCDGVLCDSDELKSGRRIRVTRQKENLSLVTDIETLDQHAEFSP